MKKKICRPSDGARGQGAATLAARVRSLECFLAAAFFTGQLVIPKSGTRLPECAQKLTLERLEITKQGLTRQMQGNKRDFATRRTAVMQTGRGQTHWK